MVRYRVARTGKPHTIVEDLILPGAADMAGTMLGDKDQKKLYRQCLHQTTLFHDTSVTWQQMFWNNYCFAYKPVNSMSYSWMSQQAWHNFGYMSVTFMGGQLRKTSSSANHWKPGQHERLFLKYWTACDIKWTLVVKMCWYLYWWCKSNDREKWWSCHVLTSISVVLYLFSTVRAWVGWAVYVSFSMFWGISMFSA